MIDLKQVRFIIGVIATAFTIGLCTIPMPKYISLYKDKSKGIIYADYSIGIMRHSMLCVFYGLPVVHKDGLLLSIVCLFIFVIEAIYLTVFFISFPDKRVFVGLQLGARIIFVVAVVLITLFAIESSFAKQKFVGVICLVSYIYRTAAHPILSIIKAVERKSVEHIPLTLYLVNFIYSGIWTAYSAIYIVDLYELIANAFGTMLFAFLLVVYAIYYKPAPKVKTE